MNTNTQHLADEPTLANGPPRYSIDALNASTQHLADKTHFGRWTPQQSSRDALNMGTHNWADKPTLADGPPKC